MTLHPSNLAQRNAELSVAFLERIVSDTSLLDRIPYGSHVFFLPSGDPELVEYNIRLGMDAIRRGDDAYFVHVNPDWTFPNLERDQAA